MLEIADNSTNDWMERRREDGTVVTVLNGEHVQRSRLRIDTRKWLLAKLQPKKYGKHVSAALTGSDGGPIKTETNFTYLKSLSTEDKFTLRKILRASAAKNERQGRRRCRCRLTA